MKLKSMLFITMSTALMAHSGILNAQDFKTINVGGQNRQYLEYVPADLGTNRPLLISMHGMNQDAPYQKNMLAVESVADTAKFVTIFPNGIDRAWDIGGDRDINFVKALIDEMVKKYQIDRKRVYLSGFSMGGMFTYHAMNRIPDLIAAFAPISGYPMGGTTATADRPVPIIHTHGTSDDVCVFSGAQPALDKWIAHNNCPTTAVTTPNYQGHGIITRHEWGPGDGGVEVVLMELAGKGHWVSNDGMKTVENIWNFCKRYPKDIKDPQVSFVTPGNRSICQVIGDVNTADITLSVNAYDNDGQIVSVEFYEGDKLIAKTTDNYSCTLKDAAMGKHSIKVVATDNDGRQTIATREFTIEKAGTELNLSNNFKTANTIPDGWITYDSEESRAGYMEGLGQGCRLLGLTGAQRDFDFGLYIRNKNGNVHAGSAKYGAEGCNRQLLLTPGKYRVEYTACSWNNPDLNNITCCVESEGKEIASLTKMTTANVGNATGNSFSGSTPEVLDFTITNPSFCNLAFYTNDSGWADALIGKVRLVQTEATGIKGITENASQAQQVAYFTLDGKQVNHPTKGVYIKQTVKNGGKQNKKVIY